MHFLNRSSLTPMIGASGAVSGSAGRLPAPVSARAGCDDRSARFFIRTVEVPPLIILGCWIVCNDFKRPGGSSRSGGGVAWYAHVAGFVAGCF